MTFKGEKNPLISVLWSEHIHTYLSDDNNDLTQIWNILYVLYISFFARQLGLLSFSTPSGPNTLQPKPNTPRPLFFPFQMKRRLWGAESQQTHGFSCKCIRWHLNPKCHQSLNKYDLRTYRSWSSYEAECYPRDWEMLYKRICGGRSSRDCWSMGRQRCMGLFCKT